MTTAAPQRLQIRPTNLYNNGYIIDFPKDGESLLLRDLIDFPTDIADLYHTLVDNERLELIAYQYYGSQIERAAELWWVIADANGIMNPLDLSGYVGKELRIPNIQRVLLLL